MFDCLPSKERRVGLAARRERSDLLLSDWMTWLSSRLTVSFTIWWRLEPRWLGRRRTQRLVRLTERRKRASALCLNTPITFFY